MIIPIRCFSCGKPIAHLWEEFKQRKNAGEAIRKILDDLNVKRFCCRSVFIGHIDLMHLIAQYKKA